MKFHLRNFIAFSILPQIGLVWWLRQHPEWVERWYSQAFYPALASFFRAMYGWVPFSVGDCLYALLLLLSLYYIYTRRNKIRQRPLDFLRNVLLVFSVAYFSFHMLWGLNYYRLPLQAALELEPGYDHSELRELTDRLIAKTNQLQLELVRDPVQAVAVPYSRDEILQKTIEGYQQQAGVFPFFEYRYPSIKKSLFSTVLTYMGYGGYLNPFTLEAQVNARLPLFRFPVIAGHEIGHQLGYSAENETNFIGYLVTAGNPDPYFQYASFAYAAGYCLAEIHRKDPLEFEAMYASFNPGVRKNFKELENFWEAFENPMEPLFKSTFNTFLKANNQAEGIRSYNKIVNLLVSFHRQYPL